MEEYLIRQYGVIEDKNWLKSEYDIKDFFSNDLNDFFDCGQGYYQDEVDVLCKIGDKFYKVSIVADIMSAKQDVGDRLYWVDGVDSIEYEEIEKPVEIKSETRTYELSLTEQEHQRLISFINKNKFNLIEVNSQ